MGGAATDLDVGGSDDEESSEQYDSHQLGYNPQVLNGGYDPQLENVRMESIRKIRGRFEHIYQKYGKAFDGVADEIDMETGVIVVNNGHLQNMEHEVDAGNGDALALSRTFEDEDDEEDEQGSSGSDSEGGMGRDVGDDSNSVSSDHRELDFSWQDDAATSLTSPDEDGNGTPNPSITQPSTPTTRSKRRKGKEHVTSDSNQDAASDDVFGQMPGIKDSMLALQDKYRNGQDMAPDDIQALGMTIANQLASFITGGKASKKRKRQTLPARFESAESSRGRPRHRSHSPVNPVAPTPGRSPGSKSLWAPMRRPKGRRTPKKQKSATATTEEAVTEETGDDSLIDSIVLHTIMHQSALEPDELQGPTTVRCCSNCKTTETLSWRRGPKAVDLCNNCGMYYYRYGLMRPLHKSSPPRKSPTPEAEDEVVDPRERPAPYSANTSRPLDGINLFGLHFSVREDASVIKLKEIDRLTWDQIAMQHPGRTPYALQCRYSKMLHGKPCEARDILSSRGYQFYIDSDGNTVARQPGEFTEEENDMLLKLREEDGLSWESVALELPGRTAEDVEERYDEMVAEHLGDGHDAEAKKGKSKQKSKSNKRRRDSSASDRSSVRYTPAEDDTILRLREDENLSWRDIANQMPGRTLASVQRHYSRDIGPFGRSRSSTPRGSLAPGEAPVRPRKYTEEEDATLMRLRDDKDLDWQQIAELMPERAATSLENRYYYKIRGDNSRPSSRASSVALTSTRNRRASLPAVDLEAQLDDVRSERPSQEDTFTKAEDAMIVKLRELECLSWEQIAIEMPGRDVSSISCRYYQYLLPRKVPEIRGAGQPLDPALQSTSLNAQAAASPDPVAVPPIENDNEVDVSMPAGVPNLSSAASTRKGSKARQSKSNAPPQRHSTAGHRSDAPMLRRALQKNLNRQSAPGQAASTALPNLSMMADGANDEVLVEGDELSGENVRGREPELLPSALPVNSTVEPPASERKLRSSSKRKSTYPETPLRRATGPYPNSGPTPVDHAPYITPSRYQAQSHPYFVANAASPEPPGPELPIKRARTRRPAFAEPDREDVLEEEIAFEAEKRSSRKRRRAPVPARAARPRPVHVDDLDQEDDSGIEDDSDDDDTAGEYFTSRKKKKSASDAQGSFRGRRSAATARKEHGEVEVVAARTMAQTSEAEDETDEEDIDMPDLGTDDDETSSESEEEDEDDDDLRCKPRPRSPLFDPRNTIEEAKQKKEGGPMRGKATAIAKTGDGNTMIDLNTELDVSSIPPEHLTRPDVSWTQLNFMALRSRAPEPMYTREIYAYLEDHFPFFRLCRGHWRDSIRGNLSTRPEFVKHSETKSALWRLADPEQEAIVVPKGSRRGRCPTGVQRVKKVNVKGTKKRGRPSNASKGLPLKRIYKRHYVPAAEKRRLAALEAEDDGELGQDAQTVGGAPVLTGSTSVSAQLETGAVGTGEEHIDIRPARPSTIEDSDAGEQFEFVEHAASELPESGETAVKTEPQLAESPYVAPTAPMNVTSDITRGPESSHAMALLEPTDTNELNSDATPMSISIHNGAGLRSSSPALASGSTGRLPRTYGRATPGTARSTLFKPLASAPTSASSAIKAGSGFAQISRSSRAGTPSSLRRTVQTPVRDAGESGDELA